MKRDLIYDVGVNDGSDTEYYLSRGYRVVGVEANPVLVQSLKQKFSDAMADGRFVLENVGIAEHSGEMQFWISDVSEWSSFNRTIASRNGTGHRPIMIQTVTFNDLIEKHGVPYYCKIDIEGNDHLCIDAMRKEGCPPYVSIEMSHGRGGEDLKRLKELGYSDFKIVSQVTRSQPIEILIKAGYVLPRLAARIVRRLTSMTRGVTAVDGYVFRTGSSGSFAEDTPGPWRSYDAVLSTWQFLHDIDRLHGAGGLAEWFDIHARRPELI